MWYQLFNSKNPNLKPLTSIDIDSRVIAYGDGFFTTMAVVNGDINWLEYHLHRIENGLQALQLEVTQTQGDNREYFKNHLTHFAKLLKNGILKLIICRKNQSVKGYGFTSGDCQTWVKLMPSEKPLFSNPNQIVIQPAASAIFLSQQIACLPKPLVGLKLLNAQDKVMLSHELWQHQTQNPQSQNLSIVEGLVQDVMGHWVEGTFCNFFYQLENDTTWYTPPINHSGVKGVMRQILLDKFSQQKIACDERVFANQDIEQICQLFFCNAVRGILPIETLILPNRASKALNLPHNLAQNFT